MEVHARPALVHPPPAQHVFCPTPLGASQADPRAAPRTPATARVRSVDPPPPRAGLTPLCARYPVWQVSHRLWDGLGRRLVRCARAARAPSRLHRAPSRAPRFIQHLLVAGQLVSRGGGARSPAFARRPRRRASPPPHVERVFCPTPQRAAIAIARLPGRPTRSPAYPSHRTRQERRSPPTSRRFDPLARPLPRMEGGAPPLLYGRRRMPRAVGCSARHRRPQPCTRGPAHAPARVDAQRPHFHGVARSFWTVRSDMVRDLVML